MNGYSTSVAGAAVLWTAAIAVGMVGTVDSEPTVRFWALMIALGACLLSGHLIVCNAVKKERIRVEDLVDGLIVRAREKAASEVPRVR